MHMLNDLELLMGYPRGTALQAVDTGSSAVLPKVVATPHVWLFKFKLIKVK